MNTRQLEYFVVLAETLSFTKTAQKFFISQTAITKQIKMLELSLETKLFHRDKHHVELTPAGNVFLPQAKQILYKIEEATERVHLTSVGFVGLLRIGFVTGYEKTSFTDLIYKLHNEYPNISLTFFRGNESELYKMIANAELDIAFNTYNENGITSSMKKVIIKRYPLDVIVHPTHPLATKKSVRTNEISGENIYRFNEAQDMESILLMVSANMGVAVLPSYCVRYLNQSQHLMILALKDSNEYVDIAATWKQENQNPALIRLIQLIKKI